MKLQALVVTILLSSVATQLISSDAIEDLFKKFMKNELNEIEMKQFDEVIHILQRSEYAQTLDSDNSVRTTLDCLICRSAFSAVADTIISGQSDEQITNVVVNLCTILGIENHNVCHGAVALNVPIITYIIRNTPEASSRSFCALVMQTVGDPNSCVLDDSRFDWEVELPEVPPTTDEPILDTRPLKIVVLTDAHIDPLYEDQAVANCDEPTCCRTGQQVARSYLYKDNVEQALIEKSVVRNGSEIMLDLAIGSQIHEQRTASQTRFAERNVVPAGYWGHYNCDTPVWAFDEVIDTITESHKDIDVVYYIGDTIDHGVWETSYELINDMNRHVVDKIRTSFGPDVLVVPVIGNHESQPTNQFAPSYVQGELLNTTWLYEALVDKWGVYLTEEAKETLLDRGDFSVSVRPGLRAISLNNNVAYRYNWWLVHDPLDAKRHLDWLVSELYAAELAGDKVHILAHIPPGVNDLTLSWTREYNRIVNRFSSTIMAEFNGHTHSDEFKIFYSLTDGSPINVAWGAGSTTTFTNYNLNYKIVDFNPVSYEPTRMINFVYNLTEANLTPNRRPQWFMLYDMQNTFGLTDLSAASFDNLVHRMVTTNKELLDIYVAFFYKLSDTRWPYCNDGCKLDQLCKTVVTVLWERQRCNELRSLYYS